MNKKLLLVLLISALMLFCFAWVYARHADETKGTTTSERPSDEVLKELKELGKRIKPETEAVPEVKLEDMPPLPHVGEVRRPSEQEYQRMLQTKGLVPTDPVKMMDNLKGSAVSVPAGVVDDRALTECLVYVHDPATCCYYHPDGEEGLWGWGVVQMKTWNDPQAAPEQSACGYPIYPFAVKGVEVQIYTVGPSKIFASFDIEDFVWDHCSPYPGEVLYESEIIEFDLPGGWAMIGVEFEDSICVYDRFFASWTFYNDMDFYPFGEEPPCWGDPVDYADTCIISVDTTFICVEPADPVDSCIVRIDSFCVEPVLPEEDSCIVRIDSIPVLGHWECVEPIIADEESCIVSVTDTIWGHWECVEPADPVEPCTVRYDPDTIWGHWKADTVWGHLEVESVDTTLGHIAPFDFMPSLVFDLGGTCEKTYWSFAYYWTIGVFWDAVCDLPAFGFGWPGACRIRAWGKVADQNDCPDSTLWWQKEAFPEYAPSGMPDFDQKQKEAMHPEIGPFDGPTAAVNCFWWMVSAGMLEPFWAVQPGCPNPADPFDPANVPFLINEFATYMGLGDCGVTPAQLDSGLEALKTEKVLWFTHEEIVAPTWEQIEYNCRISQDVLLLLGFWYEDPPGSGEWYRIGGHWVTVAGVDAIHGLLKISDPDLDMACYGQGRYYIPHLPHPPGDDTLHNDAGNVSHDIYPVMPSITPCGEIMLVEYPFYELDLNKYLGHNLPPPECEYVQAQMVPELPIFVEIEAAKIICPEEPFKCSTIWTYSESKDLWTGMTKCNYGREGARDENGFWWDPYGNALFDGSIILGNDPSNLAFFGGDNDPPGEFWPYIPMMYDYYEVAESVTVPGTVTKAPLYINDLHTRYFHNQPKDAGLPLDVELHTIGFDDPYYNAHNVIFQRFLIYNTGNDPIDSLRFALWLDWDLHPDAYLDHGTYIEEIKWGGVYNRANPDTTFGVMMLGSQEAERFKALDNGIYVHPNAGWGLDRDSLWNLMNGDDWNTWDSLQGPYDMSTIMTTGSFTIAPGDSEIIHILENDCHCPPPPPPGLLWDMESYCDFLRFVGIYRGDVDYNGVLDLSDVIYIANYKLGKGPMPMPFESQADVNRTGTVDLSDVIYLANYKLGKGPAPIDYARFSEINFPDKASRFEREGFKDLCK